MKLLSTLTETNPLDFAPALIRCQNAPPSPLGGKVLWALFLMLIALLLWAIFGRLDVVAVATGKLVPQSYLKIVQPAESGIIKDILVHEGQHVQAGQVLIRMDALIANADGKSLEAEYSRKRLSLRSIEAELAGQPFQGEPGDPVMLVQETEARNRANDLALKAALAEERSRLKRAMQDLSIAEQVKQRLQQTLPHYREQDKAFDDLARDGYVATIQASDKKRERIEKEQELFAQEHVIEAARASIMQSEKRMLQIESGYRRDLHAERNELQGQVDKLKQDLEKQNYRQQLLELKAPQAGIVKDLATHTSGTVVQPGTILLTLVPNEKSLRAEVWLSNSDIGFVHSGQPVKLKVAAFPFQKYGMLEGVVEHVGADAADQPASPNGSSANNVQGQSNLLYKTLIRLNQSELRLDEKSFSLSPGMQTDAEIWLGDRSVLEYLLSPVLKAWHETSRER